MKIAVDLDGTLVEDKPSDQIYDAKGLPEMVELINSLFDAGHYIIIYTARGMRRFNGQAHLIPFEYFEKTKRQLDSIGVKYNTIVFGKLDYDLLIDDKVRHITDLDLIKKLVQC